MADVITRLKVDSQEYDSKIKRAAQGILQLESSVRKAGESFIQTWKEEQDFVKALGQMQTMSNTARGKIAELTSAFTDLSMVYRRMSDEEKKSPFGQGLKSSLDQLKGRIQDAKRDLNSVNAELTNWRDVLGGVGQKLGVNSDLLGVVTSGTVGLTAAIGAGATAVGAAAKAWADYNAELAKQDQITTVTTGLKGGDANRMTDAARAIADTYNVDFREAINAANTLMTQFGETGDSTIQLLRDGMQGMIEGDGGKLLSMIQQYAPAFRDAGVSASQLVAVIQNSEGGIFTDQNMNAIVFGIKNIRLMTKATSDALAQLGIDGEKMSKQLSDGSLTIFDALKQVATQMQRVESGGKTAGEVMQAVFGRQGTMAGTNLAKAIAGLNTNLEETKLQTGDVGKSLSELELAQERLNSAMREVFEFDGWDQMNNTLKSKVVTALADVINHLHDVGKGLSEVGGYVAAFTTPVTFLTRGIKAFGEVGVEALDAVKLAAQGLTGPLGNLVNMLSAIGSGSIASSVNDGRRLAAYKGVYDRTKAVMSDWFQGGMIDTDTPPPPPPPKGGKKNTTAKPVKAVVTESLTELQLLQDELKTVENSMNPFGRASEEWKQMNEYAEGLRQRIAELNGDIDFEKMFPTQQLPTQARTAFEQLQDSIRIELSDKNIAVDQNTLRNVMTVAIKNGITGLDPEIEELQRKMAEGLDIPDSSWQELQDEINAKLKALGIEPIKIDFKTGDVKNQAKEMQKDWQAAASAISAVGSAMSQIEDPAAKVVGTVAQAIATMALSYSQAALATAPEGWGWIAFAATGLATLLSTISSIHSATGYANGGIVDGRGGGFVGGTAYSGDNIGNVRLDSGELILNRVQQGIVASQLESGGMQNLNLTATFHGEQLRLVLNNTSRRMGKGEYVTTRFQ